MPSRDPEALQREVEQTRAELAAAVDAIADRISPRRAAARGASRVRTAVESVRASSNGHGELRQLNEPGRTPLPGPPAATRRLRPDRIALAAAALVAVAVAIALVARSRRN